MKYNSIGYLNLIGFIQANRKIEMDDYVNNVGDTGEIHGDFYGNAKYPMNKTQNRILQDTLDNISDSVDNSSLNLDGENFGY